MRNALITGGAGFIGANFVRHLQKERLGVRVIVIDKLTYAGNLENLKGLDGSPDFSFVKGDISDGAFIDAVFEKEAIDTVINFAAESHVDRSILGPGEFITTNIIGTYALLEAAKKHWLEKNNVRLAGQSPCFLHISTDEVYGSLGEAGYFIEESPYRPNSPYAASKAASDHLVRAYQHTYGLPTKTTNCSNNFGPYQFPEKLIPLMIINALTGKPLPVYGDGRNIRDWIYVADHCAAILAVIEKGRIGETYNIGGRVEKKNIDIVNKICSIVDEMTSLDPELKRLYPCEGSRKDLIRFVNDRPGHDRRYAIDPSKIETELGWRAAAPFDGALKSTVEWYIKNRQWWERIISGEYLKYYETQYKDRF